MVKVGRKAAQLERVKLQTEIIKEQSKLRRKRLENRLKMSGKAGGKGGPARNPKKTTKREPDDDDDFLEDLVVDTETVKQPSYSTLKPGGFVTKAERSKRKAGKEKGEEERR